MELIPSISIYLDRYGIDYSPAFEEYPLVQNPMRFLAIISLLFAGCSASQALPVFKKLKLTLPPIAQPTQAAALENALQASLEENEIIKLIVESKNQAVDAMLKLLQQQFASSLQLQSSAISGHTQADIFISESCLADIDNCDFEDPDNFSLAGISAIPEPTTLLLLGLGLAGLGLTRRRLH